MFSENGLAVPIPYMAEEEPVSGYSAVVERPEEGSFKTTNTLHWIDRFYASVLWDDQDDEDGRRPSSVALHLMKNGKAYRDEEVNILRVGDSWNDEITPVEGVVFPLFKNGEPVEYSLLEEQVAYYEEPIYSGDAETAFIVTNRHRSETHDLAVYKDWNTPDTRPPKSIQVTLLSDLKKADVFKPVETVTLREPEWQHLFENLPLHHQGRLIQYRMEETVPAGYERPYIIHDGEDIRIENRKREPSPDYTYHFTFTKIWSGEALTSIDWNLYDQNGQIVAKDFTKKFVSDSEWEYDKWFDTNVNEYYIVENVPTGYMVRYENVGIHKKVTDRCYSGGRIIKHKVPPTGDRTGIWPWLLGVAAGLTGVGLLLVIRPGSGKKTRRKKEP